MGLITIRYKYGVVVHPRRLHGDHLTGDGPRAPARCAILPPMNPSEDPIRCPNGVPDRG